MSDFVNVLDFVTEDVRAHIMAGTLARDAHSGFTAAIATGKPVYVPTGPGWAYMVGSTVTVPSNTTIFSDGALVVLGNGVDNHVFRIDNGATAVVIRGLYINGNKANNTGGNGVSMTGEGGSDITIRDMYIYDCSAHGIHLSGNLSTSLQAHNNRVHSCVAGGVTSNYTVSKFSFEGNHCWLNGTHGVGILGIGKDGAIVGNVCWDNGQIDAGADNITGYNPANENLTITGNSCSGGGNNGIHVGGSRITLTANTSHNATMHGIVMFAAAADGDDCIIADNVSYGSGLHGFWIQDCHSGVMSGNIARDNTQHGFLIHDCSNLSITNNTARGNDGSGFINSGTVTDCVLNDNIACNNQQSGFKVVAVSYGGLADNLAHDNVGYGFWIDACVKMTINGNTSRDNSLSGFYYSGALNDCVLSNNVANANTESGFWVKGCTSGTVSGNIASENGIHGFWLNVSSNLAVTGNTAHNQTENGFLIDASTNLTLTGNVSHDNTLYGFTCSGTINDCVMANNVAYSNDKSGFVMKACNSGVVSGNIARNNTEHGFEIDNCTNIAITGNTARGNTLCGFTNGVESAWLTISGNTSRSNGSDGLKLNDVTHSSISGNVMNLNTSYGINVAGTLEANNLISNNVVRSNTGGQIAQMALSTRILDNETGTSNTLASAASLTLPPNGDYFYVTGTTGITSISAAFLGRRITLQFATALTITDGGNLALAGNFTTSAADTISLVYDGSNWIETSRSVN